MTRFSQWLKRRRRYIRRDMRRWNSRPRGHAHPYLTPLPRPQHTGWAGVLSGEARQAFPRVSAKTYRAQCKAVPGHGGYSLSGGTGYADPPHYVDLYDVVPGVNDRLHPRHVFRGAYMRAVRVVTKSAGRLRGDDYKSWLAFVYWNKRAVWPVWDPKHRTPVDLTPPGYYDRW